MVANRKATGKAASIPAGLAMGVGVSMAVTLPGAAVTAWLVSSERISENAIGYCALIILVLSAAGGAWMAMGKIKRRKLQMSLLAGLCYYLTLLACTALFFGGQYHGMGTTAAAVAAGSAAVALLGARGEKSRKKHHLKKGYR